MMRTINNFARLIIAVVFIWSGFVKALDPLGFTYRFKDYFEAFGMEFLTPVSIAVAFFFIVAELLIGLSLLLGVKMKLASWGLLGFMVFFTILTFFNALFDFVTDCGCFGDFMILTNWQTFWKNVIFFVPTLIVFVNRRMYRPITSNQNEWGIALLFGIIAVCLCVLSITHLPFIDVRPYKVGTHIPSDMVLPEGAPVDEYEAFFIYEKNGEQQEFSAADIPYDDPDWKYVERRTVLTQKGEEPPIHDFSLTTIDGFDITDSLLADKGYSFLVVAYNLEKASKKGLKNINDFVAKFSNDQAKFYGMTSSTNAVINEVGFEFDFKYAFHTSDEITLKTMMRANPGLMLIKNGTIIGKWHHSKLPAVNHGEEQFVSMALLNREKSRKAWVNGFFILGLFGLMLFLIILVQKN